MKKTIGLVLLLVGYGAGSRAAVVSNYFADAGFEAIAGNEPNAGTTPWFTTGENSDFAFISSIDQMHGGSQSAKFNYYFFFEKIDVKIL